jgi:fumarate reductase (CoM/CoB) subunit A
MKIKENYRETDVLIIGSGGAGLRAAIEANKHNARVLVVSKGDFPSGCTAVSMGAMLAPFHEQDSADRHFSDTLEGGDRINNQKLLRILVTQARERTTELEQFGTRFDRENDHYKLFPFTGSSVSRGVLAFDHYQGGYIEGLVNEVTKLGIEVLTNITVIDLVKDNGRIVGAVGLDMATDTVLFLSARTIVLATGGAGNLYNLTTNPPDITGDGYALAYNSGVQLSDMEFVQGRVCMIYPTGMRGTPPPGDGMVTLGGRFYNSECERYMRRYHPQKLELVTRAQMSICAQKEIQAGRYTKNGGMYGDLSGVPKEDLFQFKRFIKVCGEEQFDPTWQPYEWAPGAHHFMGGVLIDETCATNIKGLYAAGEIVAGVHGANRLAGNALTETQVFGAIAGDAAAREALTVEPAPIPSSHVEMVKRWIEEILRRDCGFDPREVKEELATVISVHVGVIRNEDGLQKAKQSIDDIKNKKAGALNLVKEKSFWALAKLIEVENLITVGMLTTTAALMRKETRGAHNREDYPELDEQWATHIVFQRQDNDTAVMLQPVETI